MNGILNRNQKMLEETNAKTERLANSLEQIIPLITKQGIDSENAMLMWAYLKEGEEADLAVVDGTTLPSEQAYPLMSWEIVEKIGHRKMTASILGMMLKNLKLKGNSVYHYDFPSGRKGLTPRYKPTVISELYERLKNYEKYGVSQTKALKWQSYLKPESEVLQ